LVLPGCFPWVRLSSPIRRKQFFEFHGRVAILKIFLGVAGLQHWFLFLYVITNPPFSHLPACTLPYPQFIIIFSNCNLPSPPLKHFVLECSHLATQTLNMYPSLKVTFSLPFHFKFCQFTGEFFPVWFLSLPPTIPLLVVRAPFAFLQFAHRPLQC